MTEDQPALSAFVAAKPPSLALAEQVVELAKSGRITSLAIIGIGPEGNITISAAGSTPTTLDAPRVVLGVEQLKRVLLDRVFGVEPSKVLRPGGPLC